MITKPRKRLGVKTANKSLCDVTTNASVVLANEGRVRNPPVREHVPRFYDHPGYARVLMQRVSCAEIRCWSQIPSFGYYRVAGRQQSHYEIIAGNSVYRAFEKGSVT